MAHSRMPALSTNVKCLLNAKWFLQWTFSNLEMSMFFFLFFFLLQDPQSYSVLWFSFLNIALFTLEAVPQSSTLNWGDRKSRLWNLEVRRAKDTLAQRQISNYGSTFSMFSSALVLAIKTTELIWSRVRTLNMRKISWIWGIMCTVQDVLATNSLNPV